jgi:hypothetical protein
MPHILPALKNNWYPNSLINFKAAAYRYNLEHGVDFIQKEIE